MRTEEKPMIARDELAARNLAALLSKDNGAPRQLADFAVECADALLSALAVPPAAPAPVAFKDGTQYPSDGERVVVARLKTTDGFIIHARHLSARKVGAVGTVTSYVPGHGGDVWFVQHDNGEVAAYCYDELAPAPAPSPTSYVPRVGDKVRTTEQPTTDKWDGSLVVLKDGFVTFAGVPHIDAIRTDDSGKDPYASGFYVAKNCVYVGPATASERAAAGLPVDEATPPPAPASVEPRRTVGAVVKAPGDDIEFIVVNPGDGESCVRAITASVSVAPGFTRGSDRFVRWATRAECERHGVPFVDRTTPAAALTEEEREGLAKALWDSWNPGSVAVFSNDHVVKRGYLRAADAAAAWFAKRGGAK